MSRATQIIGRRIRSALIMTVIVTLPSLTATNSNFSYTISASELREMWDQNAKLWSRLQDEGFDVTKEMVAEPAFLAMLSDVEGYHGLDVGCGTGNLTRLLASKGAYMTGLDLSQGMLAYAKAKQEINSPLISYVEGDARQMPFEDSQFDFATAFMSLMDFPHPEKSIQEIYRVVKPGGFIQIMIPHPCFWSREMHWVKLDEDTEALLIRQYPLMDNSVIKEWIYEGVEYQPGQEGKSFRTAYYHYSISEWINIVAQSGFIIEEIHEPLANPRVATDTMAIRHASQVPYYLSIKAHKKNLD